MSRRKVVGLARRALGLAILAGVVWLEVLRLREFRAANPGSDYWVYLADLWPTSLAGALIAIGIFTVIYWWNRDPRPDDDITEFHETESR